MRKLGWRKEIYIAKQKETNINDYGVDERTFYEPKMYMMNYQPASEKLDIALYGEKISKIYKAVIPYNIYKNHFKEGDVAYIGITPDNEPKNGYNANYKITRVMPQNRAILLYFEKISK